MMKSLISAMLLFATFNLMYAQSASDQEMVGITNLKSTSLADEQLSDVTSLYLNNPDFEEDIHNKATQGNDYFGDDGTFDEVEGWGRDKYGWGVAATYSLGHENTLHGKIVPATDAEGNTDGAVLGIVNAWGGWVKYYQNVTLPAGSYEIVYDAYNANTGTNTINYTGFVSDDGTEYLSNVNSFTTGEWKQDTIRFTLHVATKGRIQLGLGSANSGSGDKAGLFFSGIKLLSNSINNLLTSLTIQEQGVLFPEFSPAVTTYAFEAADDIESVTVSAAAFDTNNNTVTITGNGSVNIVNGKATVEVTVSHNEGEVRVYKFNVSKKVIPDNDVTNAYLLNAHFTADIHNTATRDNDYFGDDGTFDEVEGWGREKYGWGVAATYSLGHENTLHGKIVPDTDPEGNTDGAVLGIVNAWGGWVKYYQNVTLPAGSYQLIYKAFNANTGTNTINYTGFEAKEGSQYLSGVNTFNSNQWTTDTVKFTLPEKTEGRIVIGVSSANSGSGDKAALFFDGIQIFTSAKDLDTYKDILQTMIDNAQAIINEGGFYASLGNSLETAIQSATNVVSSATTLDDVYNAMADINKARSVVQNSLAGYVRLSDYIDVIDQAVNTYQRDDLQEYLDGLIAAHSQGLWTTEKIDEEIAKRDSLIFKVDLEGVENNYTIKQRFDIELVESSFPVGFSQAIANDNHYIAYYDKDKNMCIGYRKLNETSFSKTILNSKIGWDSHNYVTIIVDDEGYIHVSGNMHNVALNYWRSQNPYDATAFDKLSMVGSLEDNVTYPHFLKTNAGDLLFHYRYGWSGNGYEVYNIWDPATKTWSRFMDEALIDGEGQRNAYMTGPFYGADGYYHLYWVWRGTPDAATNHHFSYARSVDLLNWESASGEAVARPMTYGMQSLKVDQSAATSGLGMLNGVQKHTLDSQNRVVLCNMKYDELGNSQLFVYRLKSDNTWEEKCITNWIYRFQFGGGGSIVFEIQLKGMRNIGNGQLGVTYYHSKYGEGEIIIDEQTLESTGIREVSKSYPLELDVLENEDNYSKPFSVKISQLGNYILRWEAMGASNDQRPADPHPPYYMLEMIELDEDVPNYIKPAVGVKNLTVIYSSSNIKVTGLTPGDLVRIVDTKGLLIYSFTAKNQEHTLPDLDSGLYIVSSGRKNAKILFR